MKSDPRPGGLTRFGIHAITSGTSPLKLRAVLTRLWKEITRRSRYLRTALTRPI